MKISMLTPLPPAKSGVAVYASMIAPALAQEADLTLVHDQEDAEPIDGVRIRRYGDWKATGRDADEIVICQLGNNPFHEFAYEWANVHQGAVVVLHDLVLHHLIVESTLARGDQESYIDAIGRSHGSAGEALARGRAAGFHNEISNFLYPASVDVVRNARAIVVHNAWAARELRRHGVVTPIVIAGHPYTIPQVKGSREELRAAFGFRPADRVVAMMGFVTSAKRPEVVFEAFGKASAKDPSLRLLIAGEAAPNISLSALARKHDVDDLKWKETGFVTDEQFDEAIAASDMIVNLRYPTAGESSGPLTRALAIGRRIAVTDIAQFSDLPDTVVTKIPAGDRERDTLTRFMLDREEGNPTIQKEWLAETSSMAACIDAYVQAAEGRDHVGDARRSFRATLPLFADFRVRLHDHSRTDGSTSLRLSVASTVPVVARGYGSPSPELVVKLYLKNNEIGSRWVPLDRDLRPDESGYLNVSFPVRGDRVVVIPAMHGIPAPFERLLVDEVLI